MARATQKTVKTVTLKSKAPAGNIKCNMCGGKGYHKAPTRKKK